MPFNTSIYQQIQPNIAGQLAGSINEFADRRARLSDLAMQREQQAVTQGYQNRAAQRVEDAYPAQLADLELKRKKEAALQANLGLVNEAMRAGKTEEAKRLFAQIFPEKAAEAAFTAPKPETMSALGQLQTERAKLAALDPNDPILAIYDQAITKTTTHPPVAPSTSIVQGSAGTFAVTAPRAMGGVPQVQNLGIAPKQDTLGDRKPMTADQEAKYRQKFGDAYGTTLSALQSSSDVVDLAKKLKESPGLGGISGLSGYIPNIPGSESSEARQRFETLQGKITKMAKDAAAASGALGPMAVQEWKILRDQVEAIDPAKMDEKQLKNVLDDLVIQAKNAARITEETYTSTFSQDFGKYPQFANPRGVLGKGDVTPPKQSAINSSNTVTLPNGQVKTFTSAAAAQAFKKAARL